MSTTRELKLLPITPSIILAQNKSTPNIILSVNVCEIRKLLFTISQHTTWLPTYSPNLSLEFSSKDTDPSLVLCNPLSTSGSLLFFFFFSLSCQQGGVLRLWYLSVVFLLPPFSSMSHSVTLVSFHFLCSLEQQCGRTLFSSFHHPLRALLLQVSFISVSLSCLIFLSFVFSFLIAIILPSSTSCSAAPVHCNRL